MQLAHHRLQIPQSVLGAENAAVVGIDEQVQLLAVPVDHELRTAILCSGWQVFADHCLRIGFADDSQLLIGTEALLGDRHLHQVGIRYRAAV